MLLAAMSQPSFSVLTWNSGNWNSTETSWLDGDIPAIFTDGDAVEFTSAAVDKTVIITAQVLPSEITVNAPGYVFDGTGNIGGSTSLILQPESTLAVNNANSFTGGTTVGAGAMLRLAMFNAVGSVNAAESALGVISGSGVLELGFLNASTMASIQGNSLSDFTGILYVEQGNIGLGRRGNHSGAGASATLGASRVNVGSAGTFIVSLGYGQAALVTGNSFLSDVYTEDGSVIGNRDGHVNWSGDVCLNCQDVTAQTPVGNTGGSTQFTMHYGKYVVWNGIVSGTGVLELTSGVPDGENDHRLVLANNANTFNGTFRVAGPHLSTLALAAPQAAASAGVELGSDNSRLVLMQTSATIAALNGSAGVVQAEGNGNYTLTVHEGNFAGVVRDAAGSTPPGLRLGIVKNGSGTLSLTGENCSYTGATTVQNGTLSYSGPVSLGDVSVAAGATLQSAGDLTLRSGAVLSVSPSAVWVGGALVLSDAVHGVSVSGYESLSAGNYDLLTWSQTSAVTSGSFSPMGLNATAENTYSLQVNGNALQLVVGNMPDTAWLWSGGSAAWSDSSAAQWSNTGGGLPAGQQVCFGPQNAGTVTIDRVTPSSVNVMGGAYTFAAAGSESEGIVSSGNLTISGADTVVNMNLDNTSFSGNINLQGGVLEIGAPRALGAASLAFNGGMLRYGAGMAQDVSSRILADSVSAVRIDTNGNNVNWSFSDGVKQALQLGVEKDGAGTLQLTWTAAGETYVAPQMVNGGTLGLVKTSGNATLAGGFGGNGEISFNSPAGQLTVQGDNSAFSGTVNLAGDGAANSGSVSFGSGASLGGSSTLVKVAGQRFWFATSTATAANLEITGATTTYFDGSTGASYAFSGTVSGSGTLILKPSCSMAMSGDASGFSGVFTHPGGTSVTWLLGGQNVAGAGSLQATLNATGGNMTYQIWYSAATSLSGAVTGAANLRQSGAGALTLAGQNTSTGSLTVDTGCEVVLGTAYSPAAWSGSAQRGGGTFTLVNGVLNAPLTTVEGSLVAAVAAGGVVDMGGTSAAMLQRGCIDTAGQLRGISGDLNVGLAGGLEGLELSFGAANVGSESVPAEGKQTLLVQEDGALVIYDSAAFTLDNEAIKTILQGQRQAVYLHVTNADILLQNGVTAASLFANSTTTPEALGLVVLGVENGNIVLEGAVVDVYMVTENGDYPTVSRYTRLQDYKATYVDSGYTLSLQLPGDDTQEAWVNNLLGAGNFSITNTDEASGVVRVLLNNEVLGNVDSSLPPEQEAGINTANTLFSGNVTAGNAVQLVKTGSGTLTIGGVLNTPWLELDEGELHLTGQGSTVQRLTGEASLVLEPGSTLEIAADSLAYAGSLSGAGELVLNGALAARGSVGSLSGSGSLQSAGGAFSIGNVKDAVFSGRLAGDSSAQLAVAAGGGNFTLNQVQGTAAWRVQNQGNMTLLQSGADGSNAVLTLGALNLQGGSSTTLVWNTGADNAVLNLGELVVADDAALTLQSTSSLPVQLREDGTLVLGQVQSADLGNDARAVVTLGSGGAFRGIDSAWLSADGGDLVLHTLMDNRNLYAAAVSSFNARTGASMLWNLPALVLAGSPDLSALVNGVDALLDSGENAAAGELMAAAAGAGAAVLATAVAGDVERQLKSIRNRTVEMGLAPGYVHDGLPRFNAWVNAEGDRRKLQADGTDTGYSLSSWGGTVGVDVDVSSSWTAGLAFTAMYGDLEGRGPDMVTGDVDSYYLSVFGKYTHRRWKHTLVGALGWSDVDMKRYVHYGAGHYRTKGSTDGMSLGLLYELGYDIPLRTVSPALLQPIFNISYRHAGIDGFREHGSDAALRFGKQDMDVVTFGLGLRLQTTAFESLYNRSCPVYTRFLVKADAGDTRSHVRSSLTALPGRSGRVRSAESKRLGLEMGIGITIPIGADSGSLFMDCGYECRFDESEVNGTVGYRLSF